MEKVELLYLDSVMLGCDGKFGRSGKWFISCQKHTQFTVLDADTEPVFSAPTFVLQFINPLRGLQLQHIILADELKMYNYPEVAFETIFDKLIHQCADAGAKPFNYITTVDEQIELIKKARAMYKAMKEVQP